MKHIDLFSGIGGFALAASWVWPDHEVVTFCDIEPFARKVLAKHWPDVPISTNIFDLKGSDFGAVDLVTGGFPCQPFSQAGKRKGTNDDRYLWPEMLRVITEAKPRWVIGENVSGLYTIEDGMAFDRVCLDLEASGYEVWPLRIPACATCAPHRRDRWWFVAKLFTDTKRDRRNGSRVPIFTWRQDKASIMPSRCNTWSRHWLEVASEFCRVDDGLPGRVDKHRKHRIAALGNAIVPQVAYQIMQSIREVDTAP
jgi:DNA (cytosine-5)-methyltransferase 1